MKLQSTIYLRLLRVLFYEKDGKPVRETGRGERERALRKIENDSSVHTLVRSHVTRPLKN